MINNNITQEVSIAKDFLLILMLKVTECKLEKASHDIILDEHFVLPQSEIFFSEETS